MKRFGILAALTLAVMALSCAHAETLPTARPLTTKTPVLTAAPEVTPAPQTGTDDAGDVQPEAVQEPDAAVTEPIGDLLARAAVATPEPEDGIVSIKLTAVGDCTFGGDVRRGYNKPFDKLGEEKGIDYFFDKVRTVFQNDDLTIVNLEGPLTTAKKGKSSTYVFKADPKYIGILSGSSVELANLANNHAYDYYDEGADETKALLTDAGIQYSGFEDVAYFEVNGVRIASVGYSQWRYDTSDMVKAIEEARPNCDILIFSVHWGVEGRETHSKAQQKQAHALIDAGADIVIGTHSHTYGGVELYNGKYIIYSLGNFCFAGNPDPYKRETYIFQEVLNFDTATGEVSDGGISIIPAKISGAEDTNDYQPYMLEGEAGKALLDKIEDVSEIAFSEIKWLPESYEAIYGLYGMSMPALGETPEPTASPTPRPENLVTVG